MKNTLRRFAGNWWVKVLSQKLIGLIPGRAGSAVNLKLASLLQGDISERPTAGTYRIIRSVRNISLIREHNDVTLKGRAVLEIGTGWRGGDPLLFLVCGARSVTTVDHARWLTLESLRHSIEMIRAAWNDIQEEVSHHVTDGAKRLEDIRNAAAAAPTLEEALAKLNITYAIRPDADPTALDLAPGSIDLFYSESVLQRVPEPKLRQYAQVVCGQILKPGGSVFHRTDQRDIHTLQHVGNKNWALTYLVYPEWVFHLFLNGRFISQNRLRESDFIEIFAANGIVLRYIESRRHEDDLERVKQTRFAKRFRDKAPEDIATRCSILLGRKEEAEVAVAPVRHQVVGDYDAIEA